jgi:hypothetical protein
LQRAGNNTTKAALLWIRENPVQYLELCVVRLQALLGPVTGQMSPTNRMISTILWVVIFPAGFCGLWILRRSPFARFALFVMLFEIGFETLVVAGWQPRYRLPVDLMLAACAGVAYAGWVAGMLNRLAPSPEPAAPARS